MKLINVVYMYTCPLLINKTAVINYGSIGHENSDLETLQDKLISLPSALVQGN